MKQFYLGYLAQEEAKQLAKIIQENITWLHPFLFFRSAFFLTLQVKVENQTYLINPLSEEGLFYLATHCLYLNQLNLNFFLLYPLIS